MSYAVPSCEPTELVAGDSWQWDRTVSDFPPSAGWSLAYRFNGPAAFEVAASTSAAGDFFAVRAPAVDNATRAAGAYRVAGFVTRGGERFTVFEGVVTVRENLATAAASQTHAERTLAVLQAAIEGRLTADVEEYEIAGRSVKKIPMPELVRLRNVYAEMVRRERNPGSLFVTVGARFGPPR